MTVNDNKPWPEREDIKWEPTTGQIWMVVMVFLSIFWVACIGGLGKLFGWW